MEAFFFFSSSFQLVCCESQWRTLPACFGQPTSASLQFSLSQSMRSSHTYFKGWAADSLFALEANFHMNKNNPEQSWDYPSCVSIGGFYTISLFSLLYKLPHRRCSQAAPCVCTSRSVHHFEEFVWTAHWWRRVYLIEPTHLQLIYPGNLL